MRQVAAQARQVGVPRPDDTLAALAAAAPAGPLKLRERLAAAACARHLVRAAVRGGRGGRHHAGHQRRPGLLLLGAAGALDLSLNLFLLLLVGTCFVLVAAAPGDQLR